jgi:hypothetical protein
MNKIANIPYAEAEFDKDGKLLSNPQVPEGTTDLIVISHGWKNARPDAEKLYTDLMTNLAQVTKDDEKFKARKVAIIGVIWPAKQWDLAMTHQNGTEADEEEGGAASVDAGGSPEQQQMMMDAIDRAEMLFDEPDEKAQIAKLRALVPKLKKDNSEEQAEFVETLRKLLDPHGSQAATQTDEDGSKKFFKGNKEDIFTKAMEEAPSSTRDLEMPLEDPAQELAVGEGSGEAANFLSFLAGPANAVINLLNISTYFKMKMRAGTVGSKGVAPLIDKLAEKVDRIHLVGHSFGGRLVTAAAMDSKTPKLHSVSLLQAAFSHHGFSRVKSGFFRRMVKDKEGPDGKPRVAGAVIITHSKFDRAVGLAYPAASRISHDEQAAFGGPDDVFGGIGTNGAIKLDGDEIFKDVNALGKVGTNYDFKPGKLHNLKGDEFIVDRDNPKRDAHGIVYIPEVAWAISRAIIA